MGGLMGLLPSFSPSNSQGSTYEPKPRQAQEKRKDVTRIPVKFYSAGKWRDFQISLVKYPVIHYIFGILTKSVKDDDFKKDNTSGDRPYDRSVYVSVVPSLDSGQMLKNLSQRQTTPSNTRREPTPLRARTRCPQHHDGVFFRRRSGFELELSR